MKKWTRYVGDEEARKLGDTRPLKPVQLSKTFENWQFRADQFTKKFARSPKVSIYCEDRVRSAKKLKWIEECLPAGGIGFEYLSNDQTQCECLVLCVGQDPESDHWKEVRSQLYDKGAFAVCWVGVKKFASFDDFVGESSNLVDVYEKFYEILEEGI